MENYVKHKLMGGPIILKQHVVPHIFDCQPDRKRAASTQQRSLPLKRQRQQLIEEAQNEALTKETKSISVKDDISSVLPSCCDFQNFDFSAPSTSLHSDLIQQIIHTSNDELTLKMQQLSKKDIAIQAKIRPKFRSKSVMCKMKKNIKHIASSPVKCDLPKEGVISSLKIVPQHIKNVLQLADINTDMEGESSSSYIPPTSESEFHETKLNMDKELEQESALSVTLTLISTRPKFYLGVPLSWSLHLINLLCSKTNSKKENMLTLMKIKLNDSFSRLADQFGVSTSQASKIFKKTLTDIEPYLKTLIYWPDKKKIKQLLPIAFRARFSNVQSIIDCLEIEIEKPSNPVKQALTWSEYKKCNTLKYLISCTPDGFINFVSKGYGGMISDTALVEDCGYLNVVPEVCAVMADRGFKEIGRQLHEHNCKLIRPSSVSNTVKPTKEEVLPSKHVASLRIHVERVIRRVREFLYLKPHSVIDHSLIGQTDSLCSN